MKFDHDVKLNGVWYKAGTEIPVSADASASTTQNKVIEDEAVVNVASEIEEESKPTKRASKKKAE